MCDVDMMRCNGGKEGGRSSVSYDKGRWDVGHAAPQTAYLIVSVYLFV